jgi:protein SCO1/2
MSRFSHLLILVTLCLSACASPAPQFIGTDLGGTPAPDFHLTDQNGAAVSLASLQGKVVVLTFFFTHCPDACPRTAETFRQAADQLGADADRVAFVAVSLDPEGDTPQAIQDFLTAHRVTDRLLYLTGPRADVEAVWKSYAMFVATPLPMPGRDTKNQVNHSDRIILIDASGQQRVNLHTDVSVADLVKDLQLLLH